MCSPHSTVAIHPLKSVYSPIALLVTPFKFYHLADAPFVYSHPFIIFKQRSPPSGHFFINLFPLTCWIVGHIFCVQYLVMTRSPLTLCLLDCYWSRGVTGFTCVVLCRDSNHQMQIRLVFLGVLSRGFSCNVGRRDVLCGVGSMELAFLSRTSIVVVGSLFW